MITRTAAQRLRDDRMKGTSQPGRILLDEAQPQNSRSSQFRSGHPSMQRLDHTPPRRMSAEAEVSPLKVSLNAIRRRLCIIIPSLFLDYIRTWPHKTRGSRLIQLMGGPRNGSITGRRSITCAKSRFRRLVSPHSSSFLFFAFLLFRCAGGMSLRHKTLALTASLGVPILL